MITRNKLSQEGNSDGNKDSALGESVSGTSAGNTNLIDLCQTLRSTNITAIPKMTAILSFGEAMRLVPSFIGGSEGALSIYEKQCEFIMSHIGDDIKTSVFDAIFSKLTGDGYEAVRYRNITSWQELKSHLRTNFGKTHCSIFTKRVKSNETKF